MKYHWVQTPRGARYVPVELPAGTIDPRAKVGSAWARTHRGRSLRVHPDQVSEFNEAAHAAHTGAYYDTQGNLCADSEGAMQREYARRGFYDKNAGARDQSYAGYKEFESRALETAHLNVSEMRRGNL